MKQFSTVIGFFSLTVVPGDSRHYRGTCLPATCRSGLSKRLIRAAQIRREARPDATAAIAPVAIDSETGEPCYLDGRQASLVKTRE